MPTQPFTKTITAQFEWAQNGRRKHLIGHVGQLTDESGVVLHSQLYDTKSQAEQALDALVHELLIDYAERGLVDTLPAPLVAQPDPITARLAQALANTTKVPTYVVAQHDRHIIQDDADIDVYGGRAHIVATYQPRSADDNPDIDSTPDTEGPSPLRQPRAVTLTSILIDEAAQRNRLCPNCQGAHWGWQCPEIAQAAAAPLTPVELGAALCGMLWCDPASFVRLLERSTPARRAAYASAYIAFLRSERGSCSLAIRDVLARWLPSTAMQVAA